jgi:hypothetical protein
MVLHRGRGFASINRVNVTIASPVITLSASSTTM